MKSSEKQVAVQLLWKKEKKYYYYYTTTTTTKTLRGPGQGPIALSH